MAACTTVARTVVGRASLVGSPMIGVGLGVEPITLKMDKLFRFVICELVYSEATNQVLYIHIVPSTTCYNVMQVEIKSWAA